MSIEHALTEQQSVLSFSWAPNSSKSFGQASFRETLVEARCSGKYIYSCQHCAWERWRRTVGLLGLMKAKWRSWRLVLLWHFPGVLEAFRMEFSETNITIDGSMHFTGVSNWSGEEPRTSGWCSILCYSRYECVIYTTASQWRTPEGIGRHRPEMTIVNK